MTLNILKTTVDFRRVNFMEPRLYLKIFITECKKKKGIIMMGRILGKGKDLNFSLIGSVVLSKLLNLSTTQIYQLSN